MSLVDTFRTNHDANWLPGSQAELFVRLGLRVGGSKAQTINTVCIGFSLTTLSSCNSISLTLARSTRIRLFNFRKELRAGVAVTLRQCGLPCRCRAHIDSSPLVDLRISNMGGIFVNRERPQPFLTRRSFLYIVWSLTYNNDSLPDPWLHICKPTWCSCKSTILIPMKKVT